MMPLPLRLAAAFLISVGLGFGLGCDDSSGAHSGGSSSGPAPAAADPALLRVALLPDENPSTIIRNNQGLKQYLEQKLSKSVELVVTTDYSSMIEAMRNGRLELAYFGPLSYVLCHSKCAIEPFAALRKGGTTTYQSVVIANVASGIDSIEGIRGKVMAFGDPASTSSHLIPKSMLAERGLVAKEHYSEQFVGAHDAVAKAVELGHAQAGGLSKPIWESLVERKLVDPAKVRVLAESRPYPQYPWTMRSDLAPALKERIREAFLKLADPAVMKPFKAEGFGPITDGDYKPVRDLISLLSLDPSKF